MEFYEYEYSATEPTKIKPVQIQLYEAIMRRSSATLFGGINYLEIDQTDLKIFD